MFYSKKSIAQFLEGSKILVLAVKDDDFIKERIKTYNYDDARLDECLTIFNEAKKAESEKSKEYGEQYEAKSSFDKLMDEAEEVYRKHTDFLKLALRDDTEKQKRLLLLNQPRSRKMSDWFKHVIEFYGRLLEDEGAVAAVSIYGITKEELEKGSQKVLAAETAKFKHIKERGEAQDATDSRNATFDKLSFAIEELIMICTYALEDRPQLLEKIGLPVLSRGYKRKRRDKDEDRDSGEPFGEAEHVEG